MAVLRLHVHYTKIPVSNLADEAHPAKDSNGIAILVETATDRGVPTLAVSDRRTAPAATLARHALAVRSDNMMFTNSFGAVSVLLNALVTEIAVRNREHAVEAVGRISRILEEDDDLIGGGP